MRRFIVLLAGMGLFAAGFLAGRLTVSDTERVQRTVALNWGDGKYGPAFYGAWVYLEPNERGYSVRGRVWIGSGNDYWHDCGELGQVKTHAEAVQRWGTIAWKPEGLYIGKGGTGDYFLPRKELESHR